MTCFLGGIKLFGERKEENLEQMLREQAKRLWGEERAKELALTLRQLASSIAAITNYEIPLEEEPAFFR